MSGFQEELERRAGGSLSGFQASNGQIRSWNEGVEAGHARAFDDRVLLGLGIDARAPEHGDKGAYQVRVGRELGRSERWVRETVQVALAIRGSLNAGVDLPTELRRVPWRVVPQAIANVEAGRALDYRPPKAKKPATVRGVRKLVKQLASELTRMEDPAVRERERGLAIEALSGLEFEEGPEAARPSGTLSERPEVELRPEVDRPRERPPGRLGRGEVEAGAGRGGGRGGGRGRRRGRGGRGEDG